MLLLISCHRPLVFSKDIAYVLLILSSYIPVLLKVVVNDLIKVNKVSESVIHWTNFPLYNMSIDFFLEVEDGHLRIFISQHEFQHLFRLFSLCLEPDVSVALLRFLKLLVAFFCDGRVSKQEEFLNVNVSCRNFNVLEVHVVDASCCVKHRLLRYICFIGLQANFSLGYNFGVRQGSLHVEEP